MPSYLLRDINEAMGIATWTLVFPASTGGRVHISSYVLYFPIETARRPWREFWELHIFRGFQLHRTTMFGNEGGALAFIASRITVASGRYFVLKGEDLIRDDW